MRFVISALHVLLWFGLASTAFAQEDCVKCKQVKTYICLQNYGECAQRCRSLVTPNKDACKRRCIAVADGCDERAASKCGNCQMDNFPRPPNRNIQ
jgi:hypothetical protein